MEKEKNLDLLDVVFVGSGAFGSPSLLHLIARDDIHLNAIVTGSDTPSGRGRKLRPTDIAQVADEAAVSAIVHKTSDINAESFLGELESWDPDILIVTDFGQILRRPVLDAPILGSFNLHGSLLPAYRGAAPIQRAILDGAEMTGVTLIRMDEGCDTGPVMLYRESEIAPETTYGLMHAQLSRVAADILEAFIDFLVDNNIPDENPQDDRFATKAPKISKDELKLDWNMPAWQLSRQIRAFSPEPGAFTSWQGKRLKIYFAHEVQRSDIGIHEPGLVVDLADGFLTIGAGANSLLAINDLQMEGAKLMDAEDFVRGRAQIIGSSLG